MIFFEVGISERDTRNLIDVTSIMSLVNANTLTNDGIGHSHQGALQSQT